MAEKKYVYYGVIFFEALTAIFSKNLRLTLTVPIVQWEKL